MVAVNASLLQAAIIFVLMEGLALTVTTIGNVDPGHNPISPEVGVTV